MFLYFGDGGEIVQLVLQPLQFVQAAAGFPRRKTAVFVEHDGGGRARLKEFWMFNFLYKKATPNGLYTGVKKQ